MVQKVPREKPNYIGLCKLPLNFGNAIIVVPRLQRDGVTVTRPGVANKSFRAQAIAVVGSIKIFRSVSWENLRSLSRQISVRTFQYVEWLAKWNGVFLQPFKWKSCTKMSLDGAGHVAGGLERYFDTKIQIVSPGGVTDARQRPHADGDPGVPITWPMKLLAMEMTRPA